jgi:alkyl hydroperoxide reductase subunit AhpC
MKSAIALLSILGSAALAGAQTNDVVFPQLLSPTGAILMTNAQFRTVAGSKIIFRNDNGYQTYHTADLNTDVLATLHVTAAQLDARQKTVDAANQRYREQAANAALFGNPQIGRSAFNFTASDTMGKKVSLGDFKGKIVVLESYYNGCPFCENHYQSGAMQELQREFTTNGVVWLLINSVPPVLQLASPQIQARARQDWTNRKMAITDWIIDDTQSQIARAFAMKTAPEAVIINTNGVLAYEGAFDNLPQMFHDDEYATLNADPRTARNYVREALRALLAGQPVPVPETKPYGCRLTYPGWQNLP